MSPGKWTDCSIEDPKHNEYVMQLRAHPLGSSKSCTILVPSISNQDPAPFFLLPPTHHQPFLVLYFVTSQTESAGPASCFIQWAASFLPMQGDWLHVPCKHKRSCRYTAEGWLWSPEPCPGKAGAPTSLWALLKGTEWALMSHMGNHVGSVQCWSSWPGQRQILPISWWQMPHPLCKTTTYKEPLVTSLNLISSWVHFTSIA